MSSKNVEDCFYGIRTFATTFLVVVMITSTFGSIQIALSVALFAVVWANSSMISDMLFFMDEAKTYKYKYGLLEILKSTKMIIGLMIAQMLFASYLILNPSHIDITLHDLLFSESFQYNVQSALFIFILSILYSDQLIFQVKSYQRNK